uniref:THD domain-containing protein n=1 Tax=Pogona vitticeps TaxID=103695 RepID=A0A6J0V968_9SAUR
MVAPMEVPEALSGPRLLRSCSAARCALGLTVLSLVASLTALVVTLTKQPPLPRTPLPLPRTPPPLPPAQQNYAQLVLKLNTSSINERKLDWYTNETIQGVYLGQSFEYSNKTLKVSVGGLYCIYTQINFTRNFGSTAKQEAMNASVLIHRHTADSSGSLPILTLPLDLSHRSKGTMPFKAVLYRLENNDRLHVTIKANNNGKHYGSLSSRDSFFGLFQILDTVPR